MKVSTLLSSLMNNPLALGLIVGAVVLVVVGVILYILFAHKRVMGFFKKRKEQKAAAAAQLEKDQQVEATIVRDTEKADVNLSSLISPEAAERMKREKDVKEAREQDAEKAEEQRKNTSPGFYNPLAQIKKEGE